MSSLHGPLEQFVAALLVSVLVGAGCTDDVDNYDGPPVCLITSAVGPSGYYELADLPTGGCAATNTLAARRDRRACSSL